MPASSTDVVEDPQTVFRPATPPQIERTLAQLHELYPDADCELSWRTPLELLIKTILSAQSTDKRVNEVGEVLFEKYRSARDFAESDLEELQEDVRQTGFFRQKAKNVRNACRILVEKHDGEVPRTMEELVELPGVARKTGNVVLGTAFGQAVGVVVDTHVKRLAYRLGWTEQVQPPKIEKELMERLPQAEWILGAHAVIWHGRRVCHARKPDCAGCDLTECPRNGVEKSTLDDE